MKRAADGRVGSWNVFLPGRRVLRLLRFRCRAGSTAVTRRLGSGTQWLVLSYNGRGGDGSVVEASRVEAPCGIRYVGSRRANKGSRRMTAGLVAHREDGCVLGSFYVCGLFGSCWPRCPIGVSSDGMALGRENFSSQAVTAGESLDGAASPL